MPESPAALAALRLLMHRSQGTGFACRSLIFATFYGSCTVTRPLRPVQRENSGPYRLAIAWRTAWSGGADKSSACMKRMCDDGENNVRNSSVVQQPAWRSLDQKPADTMRWKKLSPILLENRGKRAYP
ncbi:hypothetical protein HPB52_008290 [Rhipicephalus sanguineus]|uniref:Uncharacterized protein n=1 Tax=Rhipicephalus sanguineus TaxID=34632 RepID=A0A9D4Q5K8_RHISA|nr:hypothetical protein HPB52_008290 [Rhipicephalus sanguineus]